VGKVGGCAAVEVQTGSNLNETGVRANQIAPVDSLESVSPNGRNKPRTYHKVNGGFK
jgi:hypothetical protein